MTNNHTQPKDHVHHFVIPIEWTERDPTGKYKIQFADSIQKTVTKLMCECGEEKEL